MSTENAKAEGARAPKPKVAKVTIKAGAKDKPAKVAGKPAVVKVTMNTAPKGTKPTEIPDGLPKKYFFKSTFNTHDIMHSPVEKTIHMIDKILSGERLFTM
jgi:hypothetical protein